MGIYFVPKLSRLKRAPTGGVSIYLSLSESRTSGAIEGAVICATI